MKIKVIIVILAVVCAGLAIALFAIKKQGEEQHTTDVTAMGVLSNDVLSAQAKINDLNDVNLTLSNNLVSAREQADGLSNHLAAANSALAASQSDLNNAKSEITGLNAHISDLEVQNKTLDDRLGDLTNKLAQLNTQIADTQQKLASSEAGNAFLQQELQKQMAQKAALEHKFNDLDELRQQVKKIKSDMFVARRLQIMKYDNSQKKGAELMVMHRDNGYTPPPTENSADTSLNVEIGSDGSVRVIPPMGTSTNAAAH
jgi:chromosome segregation ATPase